ncbi:MAG: peptidoglycan DD-metalloendopeptidase family protein [Gemmatimonadetes bacterium]|nr:peptidoglycan DD-metalloendopeptidase family protein [Gemmatimonadota bacterium]
MGSSLAFVLFSGKEVPTVGLVPGVFAVAPERVELRALSRDETLGELLEDVLDASDRYGVVLALRERANPRRLRPGTEVAFRWFTAAPSELRAVDIVVDADLTVRMTPSPLGWTSSVMTTPVVMDTVWASGVIEVGSSLWAAVVGSEGLARVDPQAQYEFFLDLSNIFQWQVDFDRDIRSGDFYRFSYERAVRPDGTMRVGHVLSAELVNRGRAYLAAWFDPNGDGAGTYYDEDGNSVRLAFLLSPIALRYRISSGFTNNRFHPVLRTWRAHRGVDFAAATGTPVRSTGNGVIIERARQSTYGNTILIRHSNGWTTRYAHMSRFASGKSVGSRVDQGEIVGYVGMTGLATGPHLHYEMRVRGRPADPLANQLPAGDPVPTDQWGVWEVQARARLDLLDRLEGETLAAFMRSAVLAHRGRTVGALSELEVAIDVVPRDGRPPLLAMGARIASEGGVPKQAADFRERIIRDHPYASEVPAATVELASFKATTPEALTQLSADGVYIVMLTGDNRITADAVARQLGIEGKTSFLGLRDDVDTLMRRSDILVHPAIWEEAFGLTVVEGMSSGCCVLASRVGGIPELLEHGSEGFLVEPGNVESLVEHLDHVARDPAIRVGFGAAARSRVLHDFDLAKSVGAELDMFEAAVRA